MESDPDRKKTPQVQAAMEVLTSDGKLIGYVTKVRKKDFRVHGLVAPDAFFSYTIYRQHRKRDDHAYPLGA